MELSYVSKDKDGPMLSFYLYDTNSVQDRLFQRSQSIAGGAEQTTDGKIGNLIKVCPEEVIPRLCTWLRSPFKAT
jgi:hypothetical protein